MVILAVAARYQRRLITHRLVFYACRGRTWHRVYFSPPHRPKNGVTRSSQTAPARATMSPAIAASLRTS